MTLNTLADLVGPYYLTLFKSVGLIAFGALLVLFAQLAWETFGLPLRMEYRRWRNHREMRRLYREATPHKRPANVVVLRGKPWLE